MYLVRRDRKESLYDGLQHDSLEMLQELCGRVWSDYNAHDPGVTMLDVINYALLELDYRFGFPLPDYLAGNRGAIDLEHLGLFPPAVLSTESVVTPADYERLMINKIEGVVRCRATLSENGIYRFELQAEPGSGKEHISRQAEWLYHACRNLGEDLGGFEFAEQLPPTPPAPPHPFGTQIRWEAGSPIISEARHHPLRYDLPDCYGVNGQGAAPADAEHHARIRQLRGYLLLFDQLLKDALWQAQEVPQLFALSDRRKPREKSGTDDADICTGEEMSSENPSQMEKRRSAYLDMLDTLYGEDTRLLFPGTSTGLQECNRKRMQAIRRLVRLNAVRAKGIDQSDSSSVPGICKIMSALCGLRPGSEMPLTDLFSRFIPGGIPGGLNHQAFYGASEEDFVHPGDEEPMEDISIQEEPSGLNHIWSSMSLLRDNLVFEGFLAYGANPDHYRCTPGPEGCRLAFRYPAQGDDLRWIALGSFDSEAEAFGRIGHLCDTVRKFREYGTPFYLVEHILLRPAGSIPDTRQSLKITFMLPRWLECAQGRSAYEERLRARLPAHLVPEFRWLRLDDMLSFEFIYFRWRRAMASRDDTARTRWAEALNRFLSNRTPTS